MYVCMNNILTKREITLWYHYFSGHQTSIRSNRNWLGRIWSYHQDLFLGSKWTSSKS